MTSKPKVLFITPLPPPVHGSAMMSQYIKESRIINEEFDCDFVNLSTSRRMDEIGKVSCRKLWRFMAAYFIVLWKLIAHKYALCYLAITCHGSGFLKDMPFVLLCKLFRRKIVIHQHNKGMSNDVDRWPYRWLLPLTYRDTKVILLSWRLYPDIEKVVKREQILICPNGIPDTSTEKTTAKRNNAVPQLLFLSNLIESKGVFLLLDACKILKEEGFHFVCNFVGGETKEIDAGRFEKEVAARGLSSIIKYSGSKYGKEKELHWNNADIFVFPTRNETFGLVLLEAMQHKLPIIATNEGGIKDIVQHLVNGLISESNDTDELCNNIKKLLTEERLREQMGEESYKIFKQKFTLAQFEKCLSECINTLISGGVNLVIYHGKKYDKEKELFWNNADIFVFPTFYKNECFPIVLLEAMQHKLPIITTNEGGIKDIVQHLINGLVSESNDTDELCNNIKKLLTEERLREQMGEESYKIFKQKFTLAQFEKCLSECINTLISGG